MEVDGSFQGSMWKSAEHSVEADGIVLEYFHGTSTETTNYSTSMEGGLLPSG